MEHASQSYGNAPLGLLMIVGFVYFIILVWKRPKVYLVNKTKNEKVGIKVGFNFSFYFLGCLFFGLVIYLHRLWKYGIFTTIFVVTYLTVMWTIPLDSFQVLMVSVILIIYFSYLGFNGNYLIAKSLIEKGYEFLNPESEEVLKAKMKWGIN